MASNMIGFKISPLRAFWQFVGAANPTQMKYIKPEFYTVGTIQDLGATANPNTLVTLRGDGNNVTGTTKMAYNRLNPKNTFNKFGDVLKRPTVLVYWKNVPTGAQATTVGTIISNLNRSLGLAFDTESIYKDFDGSKAVTIPVDGTTVDVDIVVSQANSLRFRPDATNPLKVKLKMVGSELFGMVYNREIKPLMGSVSTIPLNNGGFVNTTGGKRNANMALYNVEFDDIFDGLVFADDIEPYADATGFGGPVKDLINERLTTLGLDVQIVDKVILANGIAPADIFTTAPDKTAGGNPRMAGGIVVEQAAFTAGVTSAVTGKLTLHLRNQGSWDLPS